MWGQPRNPFGGDLVPPVDPTLGVPPLRLPLMAAAVQQKPKFFGEGGTGRTIIGIIADALAGATGGQGMYAPLMLQKRQLELQREEERRKANAPIRTEIGGDYVEIDPVRGSSRVLYKGSPKAVSDELTRALDAAGITDPLERAKYFRAQVEKITAPPMMSAPGFDEQGNPVLRFFPRTGQSSTPSTPPPAAVEHLRAHPELAPDFERKYGSGSASQYLGGPTPRASGTFR